MSEWKKVKLGEICSRVTSGGTPKANVESFYSPPTIPWLKTKEVNYSRIYETENYISEDGLANSSAKLIAPNSVIIAMYGQGDTAGRVAINKIPLTTNQACCNLTFDDKKANYEFVYYQLCTLYDKMVSLKSGAAQPNLNAQIIKGLEISLPSLTTQNHIATILSRYDILIENYQKQIKLLEEAAQRLYKEWFVDLRFPGYENTKIVDGVPEGWEKKTLDSFCNVFTGKKNANQGVPNGEYKFFTCGDTPLLINSYIYDGPAIIISGNGSYTGRTTFYEGKFDLYQRTYACTIKDTNKSDLIYGLYEIVKCELTNKISGGTHGAAIPYIVMSDLTKFDFLFNESIMHSFSTTIKNFLSISLKFSNQIHLLTEARDRLLPKLMSGEIAV